MFSQSIYMFIQFDTNFSQVSRLVYTNSGMSLLALASNSVHKLWKWKRNDRNPNSCDNFFIYFGKRWGFDRHGGLYILLYFTFSKFSISNFFRF